MQKNKLEIQLIFKNIFYLAKNNFGFVNIILLISVFIYAGFILNYYVFNPQEPIQTQVLEKNIAIEIDTYEKVIKKSAQKSEMLNNIVKQEYRNIFQQNLTQQTISD